MLPARGDGSMVHTTFRNDDWLITRYRRQHLAYWGALKYSAGWCDSSNGFGSGRNKDSVQAPPHTPDIISGKLFTYRDAEMKSMGEPVCRHLFTFLSRRNCYGRNAVGHHLKGRLGGSPGFAKLRGTARQSALRKAFGLGDLRACACRIPNDRPAFTQQSLWRTQLT